MAILLIIIILLLLALMFYLTFRVLKWTVKRKIRMESALSIIGVVVILITVNHVFFKNMRFIQSKVYSNLYLVKYPDKDQNVLQQAIKNQIIKHFKIEHKTGKSLAYIEENGIYFYEYGGRTFGFLGEAGTGYFIEHEEDLGGFVTEELGMYTNYRLAEFYYNPCEQDSTLMCGEINFYKEGDFFMVENLIN